MRHAPFLLSANIRLGSSQQLRWRLLAVPLGIVVHPPPQILASLFHRQLRLPVQLLIGKRRVRRKVENITLSPGYDLVGKITANDLAEGLDDLEDGAAAAGAQIPSLDAWLVLAEVVEGDKVALGEVENVDVVTNGGSVAGSVVWSKLA